MPVSIPRSGSMFFQGVTSTLVLVHASYVRSRPYAFLQSVSDVTAVTVGLNASRSSNIIIIAIVAVVAVVGLVWCKIRKSHRKTTSAKPVGGSRATGHAGPKTSSRFRKKKTTIVPVAQPIDGKRRRMPAPTTELVPAGKDEGQDPEPAQPSSDDEEDLQLPPSSHGQQRRVNF